MTYLNFTNAITASRLFLAFPMTITILEGLFFQSFLILSLFIIMDGMEGQVARRMNLQTGFQKNFSIVASAIFLGLTYIFLTVIGNVPILYFALSMIPFVLLRGCAILVGVKKMKNEFISGKWKVANVASFVAILICFMFLNAMTLTAAWLLLAFFYIGSIKLIVEVY